MNNATSHDEVQAVVPTPAEVSAPAEPAGAAVTPVARHATRKAWLITASYTLSLAIFAWSVALSMRSTAETPPSEAAPVEPGRSPAGAAAPSAETSAASATRGSGRRADGDAYRAEALALDRQFLNRQKQRSRSTHRLPSHEQAAARWQARVDRLRQQLRDQPSPEEGSILWGQKQQLEALLADPPTPP